MSYKGFSVPLSNLKAYYDVIIIGAGIGGLTCGNFIAKNGKRVLVIEQHFKPGGLCTSFRRKGFCFDAGAHIFGGVGNTRSFTGKIFSRLGIDLEFDYTDPFDRIHVGSETIDVPANSLDYITLLKDRFPAEADNIDHFFKDLLEINKSKGANPNNRLVKKYQMKTYYQMLSDYFNDENLKAVLSAQWGYVGLTARKVSALTMSLVLISYVFEGAYSISAGSQKLPDKLADNLITQGGEILLRQKVTDITLKDGLARGVKLEDGHQIKCGCVVSNIDARQTFFKLLPVGCLKNDFITALNNYKESCSIFMTFLGLKGVDKDLEKIQGWYFDSYDDILEKEDFLFLLGSKGEKSERPSGKNFSLRMSVPVFENVRNWKEQKNVVEKKLVSDFTKKFPQIADKIVYQESASPATIYRYTLNSKGAAYGWALMPEQDGRLRLDNLTPIRNLFLTGHWSRPNTGVASVIHSGFFVALKVIKGA
jgi:phytoene dehydrogenase-like protein